MKKIAELTYRVERKKLELQNIMSVAKVMREPMSSFDISVAVNALQKPTVINSKRDLHISKTKPQKGETQRISLQLFRNGKSIEEIASARSLAYSTVEGHLSGFVFTGEINVLEMVDNVKLEKISDLFNKNPAFSASQLRQQLGEEYSYGQIRAVMSYCTKKV